MTVLIDSLVDAQPVLLVHLLLPDLVQQTVHLGHLLPGGLEVLLLDSAPVLSGGGLEPGHEFLFVLEHVVAFVGLDVSRFGVGFSELGRSAQVKFDGDLSFGVGVGVGVGVGWSVG